MQRDPLPELDLTSDPSQHVPSPGADVQRSSSVQPDDSAFRFSARWRGLQFRVEWGLRGRDSWVAPLAVIVLAAATGLALAAPRLILSPEAGDGLKIAVAATAVAVVVGGAIALISCFRRNG